MLFNVVEGAKILVNGTKSLGHRFTDSNATAAATKIIKFVNQAAGPTKMSAGIDHIPPEIAAAINLVIETPELIATLKQSSKLQLQDGWPYYMEKIKDYPNWVRKCLFGFLA